VWLETLERSLNKGIQEELAAMERTLPFLATTGNAAPFIGLFGTVWGIMRSFHSIGLKGSASLATVAPGISEALVATAAGLAAAIPAVIAFNGFMSWMGRLEIQLRGFSNDFLNTVERQLLHGKGTSQEP
jgi:biopolymer transport protein TolQ